MVNNTKPQTLFVSFVVKKKEVKKVTDLILVLIVFVAIIEDIISYKISNKLIILGIIASISFSVVYTGRMGIFNWIISVIFPIILLYILFAFSMMGAGDIKLFAVLGGFLGITDNIKCIIISFLFGAVFSLLKMLLNKNLFCRLQYLANYFRRLLLIKEVNDYQDMNNIDKSCCIHFSIPIMLAIITVRVFKVRF